MTLRMSLGRLRKDYCRFRTKGIGLFQTILSSTFILLFLYRLCHYMRSNNCSKLLVLFPEFLFRITQHYTGIQFSSMTSIGGGVHFPHYSCIVFAGETTIGENCTIHQGVTLGRSFSGEKKGCPIIGNNVIIFPGAKVVGRVFVGDNAIIGANAVVVNDVPSNAVVTGIPARIISMNSLKCIDKEWSHYFYVKF